MCLRVLPTSSTGTAAEQSFQPAVVTVYHSPMDDIPPIPDSPRSSINSGTGSEGGRRRRRRNRSRSGSGSDWSQFSDGSTGSQFSEHPMVIPIPAMFPSIPPPSLSEINFIPIPASPPIVIQPPLAPGSGPPLMTTAPTPSLPEEQRPLSAKIRKVFSAALNLRQRVSEDESTLLDSMSPVHAIVYNHDRRAALLTQSLSASQRRKALQSCYQRICTSLLTVLDSRDAQQAVLLLEGDRAQSFLDAVQNVGDPD
ncbi:hypothetical protein B0H17DRAFT_52633 [Mycena rosella]|uniref:Uncharacterized protein n=1 Tax=Mycena rosella TaxID=1033263 RepID=A0AAD7D703_MYCRO|nr:hypothetical protein B0H17DRAFT_52633 [Mycena rosella]